MIAIVISCILIFIGDVAGILRWEIPCDPVTSGSSVVGHETTGSNFSANYTQREIYASIQVSEFERLFSYPQTLIRFRYNTRLSIRTSYEKKLDSREKFKCSEGFGFINTPAHPINGRILLDVDPNNCKEELRHHVTTVLPSCLEKKVNIRILDFMVCHTLRKQPEVTAPEGWKSAAGNWDPKDSNLRHLVVSNFLEPLAQWPINQWPIKIPHLQSNLAGNGSFLLAVPGELVSFYGVRLLDALPLSHMDICPYHVTFLVKSMGIKWRYYEITEEQTYESEMFSINFNNVTTRPLFQVDVNKFRCGMSLLGVEIDESTHWDESTKFPELPSPELIKKHLKSIARDFFHALRTALEKSIRHQLKIAKCDRIQQWLKKNVN